LAVTHILLLCGSVRRGSSNRAALDTAAAVAPTGITTTFYDGLMALPHFNPDLDQPPLPEEVTALRAAIESADALLFCTPEYAGSLPGALKELLQWTVGGVEISAKPCGWVNVSTMPSGAAGAHAELATVLRYTDAQLVDAACVHIPVSRSEVSEDGLIATLQTREALTHVLAALAAAARVEAE
jgi:NAD(P)H-dependent FMN reductase